ncbi:MAG TPA: 30S ribosomal protein S12 methylthiotransferase RimO [Actinomycetota bacterium]|nr:30S ribosomal protein S12 methylthiotransferase RimO [Actinomycetota bacterium]
MTRRVFIRTLGCPKNEADSEHLRGMLERSGYKTVSDPARADVVIVNTCSFIEASRRESVDAILDEAARRRDGQALVVAGCLVERYGEKMADELPEVDAFMSLGSYGRTVQVVDDALRGVKQRCFDPGKVPLELDRPAVPEGATAFLKISEGCDRVCTFCAIPAIRGPHRSRRPEAIEEELRWLASCGVKEVILVGQDMSLYGRDLSGRWMLPALLRRLGQVEGIRWMRMLYQYPRFVDDRLLQAMADTPSAVAYLDLSLQHASGRLLRRMKRWGDADRFLAMIGRIREVLPDAVLRSAFIVGFPGETERDVEELAAFMQEARIDWAGFFSYSREEGTEAGAFRRGLVPRAVANRRSESLTALQSEIAEAKRAQLVGRRVEVLVEDRSGTMVTGRTWREAPEVDGVVTVRAARAARRGDFIEATVTETDGVDLVASAGERRAVALPVRTAASSR